MPRLIVHKDGAYNLYTTVADGACYESALTLEQLKEIIRLEQGETGVLALPVRLDRAHRTGCSALDGQTLEECIKCNRAGPNEARLTVAEFVERYLTLPNVRAKPATAAAAQNVEDEQLLSVAVGART